MKLNTKEKRKLRNRKKLKRVNVNRYRVSINKSFSSHSKNFNIFFFCIFGKRNFIFDLFKFFRILTILNS